MNEYSFLAAQFLSPVNSLVKKASSISNKGGSLAFSRLT